MSCNLTNEPEICNNFHNLMMKALSFAILQVNSAARMVFSKKIISVYEDGVRCKNCDWRGK